MYKLTTSLLDHLRRKCYEVFFMSAVAYLCCGVVLWCMASEDWQSCEISGSICLLGWACIAINYFTRSNVKELGIVLILMFVIYLLPTELKFFGDADFIPIGMIASFFITPQVILEPYCLSPLIVLTTLLLVLLPYARYYCKKHKKVYKLFSGMQVPVLPAFAIAWWISIPLLLLWYYYLGWLPELSVISDEFNDLFRGIQEVFKWASQSTLS